MKFLRFSLVLVTLLLPSFCFVQPAAADMFEPGLKVRAGGFWAQLNSEIKAEVPGTDIGEKIDFESDLGLEESKFSPFLELTYRFNKKHSLMLNYITLHRDGYRQAISKPFELEWDGKTYTFQAGASLNTTLDLDIYQVAYKYNFISNEKFMLAGTIGAHIARIKNAYQGTIGVKEGNTTSTITGKGISESVTAPLPDFGLQAYYKTDVGLILGARAQYFQLKIDEVKGRLLDARGEMIFYLDKARHWGIGAAYQYYGVEVDYTGDLTKLDVEVNYHGPVAFLQYDF